ncbi:MAG: M28 family peptidase [Candidatus Zixiibacteriota bacterium]
MLRRLLLTAALLSVFVGMSSAADLYKVIVASHSDAELLASIAVEPIVRTGDGYLVLAEADAVAEIQASGLVYRYVASAVTVDQLALDMRRDEGNVGKYPLVYQDGNLRILMANFGELSRSGEQLDLAPILNRQLRIEFKEPKFFDSRSLTMGADLDSLIGLVSTDSLISYTERLQAFYRRVAGSDSNYASADWILAKFQEFGYDSVAIDTFTETIYGEPKLCKNVIAYKLGTEYPDRHIIVGGHRDAAVGSPGADDNASGTVSTMEIARVLANIETKVTFVFIGFDAEEQGLFGSYHYANAAYERDDTILCMFNSDMIAHYENSDSVAAIHGFDVTYAELWGDLADSLLGLTTVYFMAGGGSDHYPFVLNGYSVVYTAEWNFSSVYHSSHDSTSYLSFDYMTKLVKASLATCYTAMLNETMPAVEFAYPAGRPYFVAPGGSTLEVNVTGINYGEVVPGSGMMHYSVNGAPLQSEPLSEISPDHYEVSLPDLLCGDSITFYFSVEEAVSGTFYDPEPDHPYAPIVATSNNIFFEDDFQTNKGWFVSGNATDGFWERVRPLPVGTSNAPLGDFNGDGYCYLTDNSVINPDVDNGSTWLRSPLIDLSSGSALIRWAQWFYTDQWGGTPDSLATYISNDGGMSWHFVQTIVGGDQASGGWYIHQFLTGDFVTPSAQTRILFSAADVGDASFVEAAVDAVFIASFECNYAPLICGDADGSSAVDIDDAVFLIQYIFAGGPPPDPIELGDADCSAAIDIDDVVYLINHIFAGGPAPCSDCP